MQCRNGYVNHWEAQPLLIANYEFSSIEHGELKKTFRKETSPTPETFSGCTANTQT